MLQLNFNFLLKISQLRALPKLEFLKKLLFTIFIVCCSVVTHAQVIIGTWNLQNLGNKKSEKSLEVMVEVINGFDIVAIQEVLTSESGAQVIAKMVNMLNRKGAKWDYCISEPTTSDNVQERERYAFIWKKHKVKLINKPFLLQKLEVEIVREPYIGTFSADGKTFSLVNFHAVPKKKQPEQEIKYLNSVVSMYPNLQLIFLGDFNCPQSNMVFNTLKNAQYQPALTNQKTTLRQECMQNDCLASEYDNIFYPQKVFKKRSAGVIPFYQYHYKSDMLAARKLSDHLPVYLEIE